MASVAASAKPSSHSFQQPFEFETSLKVLVDSSTLKVVPSKFNFSNEPTAFTTASLPIVDFSALITGSGDQRSKALHDLIRACQEWGFFILVNHGIPESLMNATLTTMEQFLSLPDSEKKLYEAKSASDPIKFGNFNITNTSNQTFTLWRDYLKLQVHPEFHCPSQPQLLREVVLEYTQRTRKLVSKLLKEPDQAIGIPPHTDPGLFTLLIHNGVAGLQIEHEGKSFNVDSPHNSILVNVADQLEIFTNGRFKSVKHRGVVNSEKERISIVVVNGPSRDAVIGPAAALVEKDGRAMYDSMKYEEYLESQLTKSRFGGKSMLEQQMIFLGNE
ncbi:hypothetical protein C2S52_005611 [Perilla frutescens var. hirtella]|nr:hypothetical protein C2S52_005611 [Perilla frutescens var. hirtella]